MGNDNLMADKIRAVKDGLQEVHGLFQSKFSPYTDQNVALQFEYLGQMVDLIGQLDARIKALEGWVEEKELDERLENTREGEESEYDWFDNDQKKE